MIRALRATGRLFGAILDDEDRRILGTVIVWIGAALLGAVTAAAAAAAAIRTFVYLSGIGD